MNKYYKKIAVHILIVTFIFSFMNLDVKASTSNTTTVTIGPYTDGLEHDYTLKLKDLVSIDSITTDNGNVSIKSINGDNVVITVSGGIPQNESIDPRDIEVILDIPERTETFIVDGWATAPHYPSTKQLPGYKPLTGTVHYPRNENWYVWTEDPKNPGKYMWGSLYPTNEGYKEEGIKEAANDVITAWFSQPGVYTDSDGYSCKYSDFELRMEEGWYPREGGATKGYITSSPPYDYFTPQYAPSGNTDSTLYGYKYLKVSVHNYQVHLIGKGTKTISSGVSYKVTITYTGEPEPPQTTNNPPIPVIDAPTEVPVGEDVDITGYASDPDGDDVTLKWPPRTVDGMNGALDDYGGIVSYNTLGTYTYRLTATRILLLLWRTLCLW